MIVFGIYLLKVSCCLFVFYLLYSVALRYTTFFHLNRYYLVFGIITSFIIPFITLSGFTRSYQFSLTNTIETSFFEPTDFIQATQVIATTSNPINYTLLLSVIYFIGVSILMIRLILFIVRMMRVINNGDANRIDHIKVVRTKQSQAFTFFNTILLPEYEVNPAILVHEKIHVKQWHWVDLLLIELTCAVLWFNPLLLLYRKSIRLQHEYLADSSTIESGVPIEDYLLCLLHQIQNENAFVLVNKFYSKPIKNRIMMMTKDKTPMTLKSIYLLLIPVMCSLLFAFSSKPVAFENDIVPIDIENNKPSIAPIEMAKAKISSNFGNRIHPVTGTKRFHTGIDLLLPEGETVMATANGVVTESRSDSLHGIYVVIKHDDIYTTSYSHLQSATVKVGDQVEVSQKIGYVGSTGLSSTPHLHYEVIKNGKAVDPKSYLPAN